MASSLEVLFLQTPLPYLALFYFMMYRHELGRVFHPFHDGGSRRGWVLVFKKLGLVYSSTSVPSRGEGTMKALPLILFGLVAWAAGASLGFVWYAGMFTEAISAVALMSAAHRFLGPAASKVRKDHLIYPRLGSRIRHLYGNAGEE